MTQRIHWFLGAALSVLPVAALAGERVQADVDCATTDKALVYDCMIMLQGKKSGQPIDGAEVVVNASMPSMPMAHNVRPVPSMPMAHNVRPVTAMPMGGPGSYHAQLELQMYGQWALTLDVSGPTRDRVVETLQFGDVKADAGEHDHGKMKMQGEGEHGHGEMKEMKTTE
jgi:hypothetical protein